MARTPEEVDTELRQEFARVFGWMETKPNSYGAEKQPKTPTWPEIFAEVGKLIERGKTKPVTFPDMLLPYATFNSGENPKHGSFTMSETGL